MPMLNAAREEVRAAFQKNSGLRAGDPATEAGVKHAEEVAKILLENVVQGRNDGDNKYSKLISFHFTPKFYDFFSLW